MKWRIALLCNACLRSIEHDGIVGISYLTKAIVCAKENIFHHEPRLILHFRAIIASRHLAVTVSIASRAWRRREHGSSKGKCSRNDGAIAAAHGAMPVVASSAPKHACGSIMSPYHHAENHHAAILISYSAHAESRELRSPVVNNADAVLLRAFC